MPRARLPSSLRQATRYALSSNEATDQPCWKTGKSEYFSPALHNPSRSSSDVLSHLMPIDALIAHGEVPPALNAELPMPSARLAVHGMLKLLLAK